MFTRDDEFRIDVETASGLAVVVVAGEVDLFTAPELRERLARVDEDGAERVVLDLSRVTLARLHGARCPSRREEEACSS